MLKYFLNFVLGMFYFPVLRNLNSYFLYVKIFFQVCPPGILHFPLLYITSKKQLKHCVLNNYSSYTQLSFFLQKKNLYFVHNATDAFFFFFFRKILIPVSSLFSPFFFLVFRKILISFTNFF